MTRRSSATATLQNESPAIQITEKQKLQFAEDGFLLIKSFYSVEDEISPIWSALGDLMTLLAKENGISLRPSHSPEQFDSEYLDLLRSDRRLGSAIYDAAKLIPAFWRVCASPKHDALLSQLRNSQLPGLALGGQGVRINNPGEDHFRSPWHQDYTYQMRSIDGLVFWSPLVPVTPEMGPVELCQGSHKRGPFQVRDLDPKNPTVGKAYGFYIADEDEIVSSSECVSPLTEPGDLLVIDYLTVHRSGKNVSNRALWSLQMRYFNFEHASGISRGWKGSIGQGLKLEETAPELLKKKT